MRLSKLCLFAALAMPLAACSSLSGGSPQDHLNAARSGFAAATIAYGAICSQPQHPKPCDDPKAQEAERAAVIVANAAFDAAQASIDAGKPDSAAITQSAVEAVAAIGKLVAAMQNSTG